MELLRGYSYLRTKSELKAVRKARAGIYIYSRRVDLPLELLGIAQILGHYALAVTRSETVDMRYSLVYIINYLYRDLKIKELSAVVIIIGDLFKRDIRTACFIAYKSDLAVPLFRKFL